MSTGGVRPPREISARVEPTRDARPAGPLGLDGPFGWETEHPSAPATRVVTAPVTDEPQVEAPASPLRPSSAKSIQKFVQRAALARGVPAKEPEPQPAEPSEDEADKAKEPRPSMTAILRERLSPQGLSEMRAMMFDPKLALTVAQRDILTRLGRSAQAGDKGGLRNSILALADRLDVTSPKDGTVLVLQQSSDATLIAPVNEGLNRLEQGKRSLDMTQGGRVMSALAPVLQKKGGFSWTDGLDGGFQRLNQRFAHQAEGVVDVVVPRGATVAAPAENAPVGRWGATPGTTADSGAGGHAGGVGKWSTPDGPAGEGAGAAPVGHWSSDGAPGGGGPSVGSWSAPGKAEDGAPPGVGQWSAPDKGAGSGAPGVGQWSAPEKADGGASPGVRQWSAPDKEDGGADAGVGKWAAPPDAEKASAVGRWNAPPAAGDNANPDVPVGSWSDRNPDQPAGAVGGWNKPASGHGAEGQPDVGRWSSPDQPKASQWSVPGQPPSGGGESAPGAAPAAAGSRAGMAARQAPSMHSPSMARQSPIDLQNATVSGGVRLADILAANPKISGLRLVELAGGSPSQPTSLRELSTLGRALLQKRFGLP